MTQNCIKEILFTLRRALSLRKKLPFQYKAVRNTRQTQLAKQFESRRATSPESVFDYCGASRLRGETQATDFLRTTYIVLSLVNNIEFQWIGLRRPVAEWETPRSGHGDPWTVDLSRRMVSRIQGSIRCQTIDHVHGEVRGHVGEWTSGWIRFRDLRGQR